MFYLLSKSRMSIQLTVDAEFIWNIFIDITSNILFISFKIINSLIKLKLLTNMCIFKNKLTPALVNCNLCYCIYFSWINNRNYVQIKIILIYNAKNTPSKTIWIQLCIFSTSLKPKTVPTGFKPILIFFVIFSALI